MKRTPPVADERHVLDRAIQWEAVEEVAEPDVLHHLLLRLSKHCEQLRIAYTLQACGLLLQAASTDQALDQWAREEDEIAGRKGKWPRADAAIAAVLARALWKMQRLLAARGARTPCLRVRPSVPRILKQLLVPAIPRQDAEVDVGRRAKCGTSCSKHSLKVGCMHVCVVVELTNKCCMGHCAVCVEQPLCDAEKRTAYAALIVRNFTDEQHVTMRVRFAPQRACNDCRRVSGSHNKRSANRCAIKVADVWPSHPAVSLCHSPHVIIGSGYDS